MGVKRFRLLAGSHVGPDYSQEPVKRKDPATGEETSKLPSKRYRAGEVVEAETDLVAKHGASKFQLLGESRRQGLMRTDKMGNPTPGDPTPLNQQNTAAVAPHGQVSTGFQQAINTEGPVKGAPVTGEDLDKVMEQHEEEAQRGMEKRSKEQVADPNNPDQSVQAAHEEGDLDEDEGKMREAGEGEGKEDLESMTVAELKEIASEEEVELHGASRKDDIVKAIRKSRKRR